MEDLIQAMQAAIQSGKTTVAAIAREAGISRMQVYRIMDRENDPGTQTAEKIAKHLGYRMSLTPSL